MRKLTAAWRPCRSAGRQMLLEHYRQGRQVHWSGFSSATPRKEVALQFARSCGEGGVLLKLSLLPGGSRSRDIRDLSAIRAEDEVFPSLAAISVTTRPVRSISMVRFPSRISASESRELTCDRDGTPGPGLQAVASRGFAAAQLRRVDVAVRDAPPSRVQVRARAPRCSSSPTSPPSSPRGSGGWKASRP